MSIPFRNAHLKMMAGVFFKISQKNKKGVKHMWKSLNNY